MFAEKVSSSSSRRWRQVSFFLLYVVRLTLFDSFQPVSGNNRYYESDLPKSVNLTDRIDKLEDSKRKTLETAEEKRLQRFGIPIATYATGTGSYNTGGNVGYTNPIKIDIGGVALGALLGLGIILVIPKLSNVFSSGHGYRSSYYSLLKNLSNNK